MRTQRLALTNSLIILMVMLLVGLAVVPLRTRVTQLAIDEELATTGDAFARSASLVAPRVDIFAHRPVFVQADAPDGSVLVRSANLGDAQLPLGPADLARARSGQAWFDSVAVDGHTLRTYQLALYHQGGSESPAALAGIVQVASPLDDAVPRGPILMGLILGIAVGVGAALVVGWLLARIALAPIEQLAATADAIGSTADLSRRVPVARAAGMQPDAVQRLALGFNTMLERLQLAAEQLETALDAQRQFVADASHQLRTPLTSLRGNVHFLSRLCAADCPVGAVGQHQDVLADLDSEAERMTRLVNSLLCLARADAQQHLSLAPEELEPLIQAAYRSARALSEDVSVHLGDIPSGVRVRADGDRLIQLLLILLDNAIRYTPRDGQVTLRATRQVRRERPGVLIEVADTGPGVPEAERALIFERFYRSRATGAIEGAGLGLAVARWIALEHDAQIGVTDNAPVGSVFQVWLPAIDPAENC